MAIGQTQSVSDLLSLGIKNSNNDKANSTKTDQKQFGTTLKAFSSSYSDTHQTSTSRPNDNLSTWLGAGKNNPVGGNGLPDLWGSKAAGGDVESSSAIQQRPRDREELVQGLERTGIDPQELKERVVSSGKATDEEFERLMDSPDEFLEELDGWLQTPGLGQEILALAEQPLALQQLALLGRGGRPGGADGQVLMQIDGSGKKEPASDLVGRLLDEQGGEGDLKEGLSKDKLFEQLLNAKNGESGNKAGQFSSLMLGESPQGGKLSPQNAIGLSASGVMGQSTTQAAQALPQLPAMRGLPGQPGGTEALSERIMMMRAKNMQIAEIKLNPQELGALEVRVKVVNDVANVQFHSPNPGVREALEGQIVRLREMLDGAGLSLGDVGVSDQSLSESNEDSFAGSSTPGMVGSDSDEDGLLHGAENAGVIAQSRQALGIVDYFA